MFDSATSTLEYRPPFGRRVPAPLPCAVEDPRDERGGVDAITAELRLRILSVRRVGRAAESQAGR